MDSGSHNPEFFGGNAVRQVKFAGPGSTVLADDAYRYEALHLEPGQRVRLPTLATGAMWVLDGLIEARADGPAVRLSKDQAALFDHRGKSITNVAEHPSLVLVAGTREPEHRPKAATYADGLRVQPSPVRVQKPWGEELWINGRHPTFAFKRILLRAGHRTSLQYHEHKRETNLLVGGAARLHFAQAPGVFDPPYHSVGLEPISTIDVEPMTLHRLEAVTDLVLFEVSTPHLDDVIRVQDDTDRENGLISAEHAADAPAA